MKKFATMAICFVLIACMVAGGSLAYLTDRDSEANVFTVGDVKIDLNETFPDDELIPGKKLQKEATITNTGKNNAYVWMTIAVPATLDVQGAASDNAIHWNVPGAFWEGYHTNQTYIQSAIDKGYLEAGSTGVDISKTWNVDNIVPVATENHDGVDYNVYTLLYNSVLAPNETTSIGLSEVYLDTAIDIDEDGHWYKIKAGEVYGANGTTGDNATPLWANAQGNPVIYVSAYGIQNEGFDTVEKAYEAYKGQWGDKGIEWGTPFIPVTSDEDLADAIAKGESVTLKGDIANEEPIVIEKNASSEINLNSNTLTGTISNKGGDVVVSDGTIEQSGSNVIYNEGNAEITDVKANMTGTDGYITNSRTDDSVTVFNNVDFTSTGGGVNVWDGEAVFNSGVITTNSTSTSARHVFYVAKNGKLTINDGEFTFSPTNLTRKGSYICAQANAEVIVNGGTFHQPSTRTAPIQALDGATVTIYGGTFAFDPSAFVADGYEAVQGSDGYWTVSAE